MPEGKEISTESGQEISKSQRRREALELKTLARKLIGMSPTRLARIPLEPPLRAAVDEARRIRSNVAGKRQLQYVAKLLRQCDHEPISTAVADLDRDAQQLTARQHRAENWRDYLIDSGDPALSRLLQQREDVDIQAIRQLVRSARAQAASGKAPAAARSLFRLLRDMDQGTPLPQLPVD
jgi:ribosome-associated protein